MELDFYEELKKNVKRFDHQLTEPAENILKAFNNKLNSEEPEHVQEAKEIFESILHKLDLFLTLQKPFENGLLLEGPTKTGLVYYEANGQTKIIPISPQFPDELFNKLKPGVRLLVSDGMVVDLIPKELEPITNDLDTFKPVHWDDIGGIKSQLKTIKGLIYNPKNHADLYELFNKKTNNGILLYGPPGTGKTLIAKAIATDILKEAGNIDKNKAFIYIKGGELLSKWVGETEERIKELFIQARKTIKEHDFRPVLFIDEAEAIMAPREGGGISHSGIFKTIVPTFLAEMDGFDSDNPFVILATNLPQNIDKAVLRPGRIDLRIPIERPDLEDAKEILDIHLKNVPCTNLDRTSLINLMSSSDKLKNKLTGAIIKGLVDQAIEEAIERLIEDNQESIKEVTIYDFQKAIEKL